MVLDSVPKAIAGLKAAFRAGDSRARGRLIELFYPDLKQLTVERPVLRIDQNQGPAAAGSRSQRVPGSENIPGERKVCDGKCPE